MLPRAVLRDAAGHRWLAFAEPVDVLCAHALDEVVPVLDRAERRARADGLFAVGFVTYEAAPALDPNLITHPPGRLPLAWFALFRSARQRAAPAPAGQATALDWQGDMTPAGHRDTVQHIRQLIGRGETYQVNLSYRLNAPLPPDDAAESLFRQMIGGQPSGYGGFIETAEWAICCASPELFFARRGRRLSSRPMKGTAPRGPDAKADVEAARWLAASTKNRAENLMITDMVRNDIGRLATTGSVLTEALFQLERHPTLWQMTSTVSGDSGASLVEVLRALFPAASITGAPKRHTMQLIRELEATPREIYTGTLGFVDPGGDAQFNVAIRTAWLDKSRGRACYGVGGGIVWDSDPAEEYAETLAKARILRTSGNRFALLETLLWQPDSGYLLLDAHLQRVASAAAYFDRRVDLQAVTERLADCARELPPGPQRVRLQIHEDGSIEIDTAALTAPPPRRVTLEAAALLDNPFVRHKTTRREVYEHARQAGRMRCPEAEDVLLVNERGEVTESTIANLVVAIDGMLVTPPLDCGLLPGVYRQWLIDAAEIVERVVYPRDLQRADALYLVNSVRGRWPVELLA